MKNSLKLTVMAAGLIFGALTSNASANYVRDGDFNHPNGGGTFTTYDAGQHFGPWHVISGNVDLIGGYWQEPGHHQGSVDLDGTTPGAISQHLRVGPGTYDLTFDLSGNPEGGNPLKTLAVSVGNIVNEIFTYTTGTNSDSNMQYIVETLDFTVTGHHGTNLTFASLDAANSYWGPVIGGVSVNRVSSVPLPAGLPMFGAALLAMFGFHSFRKRQQLA